MKKKLNRKGRDVNQSKSSRLRNEGIMMALMSSNSGNGMNSSLSSWHNDLHYFDPSETDFMIFLHVRGISFEWMIVLRLRWMCYMSTFDRTIYYVDTSNKCMESSYAQHPRSHFFCFDSIFILFVLTAVRAPHFTWVIWRWRLKWSLEKTLLFLPSMYLVLSLSNAINCFDSSVNRILIPVVRLICTRLVYCSRNFTDIATEYNSLHVN